MIGFLSAEISGPEHGAVLSLRKADTLLRVEGGLCRPKVL